MKYLPECRLYTGRWQGCGGCVGGAVAGFFGEWTMLLTCLVIVIIMDYLTGWIVACRELSPKSEDGKGGL